MATTEPLLSPTRYIQIEGTNVAAAVETIYDAKAALKELRQKKKELNWHKRWLLRRRKTAEARRARAARSKPRKRNWRAKLRAIVDATTAIPRFFTRTNASMDIAKMERECKRIDEMLLSIDSVIIQVEAKLIELSS
jgi:hypothetical protein